MKYSERSAWKCVLSGTPSDSHTWNLVFLELLLKEQGIDTVIGLGCCTSADALTAACRKHAPDVVVISTVNGHGGDEALEMIKAVRGVGGLPRPIVVLGGKLATSVTRERELVPMLLKAGFDAVFIGSAAADEFIAYLAALEQSEVLEMQA